jgi:hypothetical protein
VALACGPKAGAVRDTGSRLGHTQVRLGSFSKKKCGLGPA